MRGRKPVPTALRELHGNPRHRPLPKAEPIPLGDLTDPPPWFSPEQRAGWDYAISNAPPGLLRRLDRSVMVAWVIAEDLHRQAVIAQSQTGLLIRVPTKASAAARRRPRPGEPEPEPDPGVPQQSPFISIINREAQIMIKAAGELGFTPVSRPRVQGKGAENDRPPAGPAAPAPQSLQEWLDDAPTAPAIH